MKRTKLFTVLMCFLVVVSMLVSVSCAVKKTAQTADVPETVSAEEEARDVEEDAEYAGVKWAGVRVSSYGMKHSFGEDNFPGVDDMIGFGSKMEGLYPGSTGAYILIVGTVSEKDWTCKLAFPTSRKIDLVKAREDDFYESYLTAMDEAGYCVWLQVEPGNADLVELATEVMNHYKHHSCVQGFGIDVEWYRPEGTNGYGTKLSQEKAAEVLEAVRAVNSDYTVFVKHWDIAWLPNMEEGFIYVDDSQQFRSLKQMQEEFSGWAFVFEPSPVMFQIGYDADRVVWGKMDNPALELGSALVSACDYGNDIGIIWVDFTLDDAMERIE